MRTKVVNLDTEDKRRLLGLCLSIHATYHLVIANLSNPTDALPTSTKSKESSVGRGQPHFTIPFPK